MIGSSGEKILFSRDPQKRKQTLLSSVNIIYDRSRLESINCPFLKEGVTDNEVARKFPTF
ncbi:hypothetical protein T09_2466 [Trichinella sp. T9]|uniref:Uncharacterized protein n=1 Tax=Trichinella murrelli TaxID=144512 RepID=A0A0V0U7A8_9BILA|nr:hypothetical protein T05_12364 [Trichinella murrelli]KRX54225.1 hypothetical protein T09_2466 [Trichinella sp. T9]KRZ84667.1 hypothetical protein T08_193 [Trichinella sp. T8]